MPSAAPRPAAVFVLLLAALAGCVGDTPASEPTPDAAPSTAPPTAEALPPETFTAHGTTVAAFRSNPTVFSATFPRIPFNVTANVTAILVELVWDDPVQDLDAFARADTFPCTDPGLDRAACEVDATLDGYDFAEVRDRGGSPGAPDSPSRVLATRDGLADLLEVCGDPCPFNSYPRTNQAQSVAADVEWWNFVTVFYGAVPDGFTAIPA